MDDLSAAEYRALAEFRFQIRSFLRFSEDQARACGIEPQQHQLLLAIRGLPENRRATIGELAARMQLKHHSTVELVDRLEARGAVARVHGGEDHRKVLVRLTRSGAGLLRKLSVVHHEELDHTGPRLARALRALRSLRKREKALAA